MTDVPLFDMTPRRRLKVGDAVVVETIIGPKFAVVSHAPHDGAVNVRFLVPLKRGGVRLSRPNNIEVGRVSHA